MEVALNDQEGFDVSQRMPDRKCLEKCETGVTREINALFQAARELDIEPNCNERNECRFVHCTRSLDLVVELMLRMTE